jgi:hypothetical protein
MNKPGMKVHMQLEPWSKSVQVVIGGVSSLNGWFSMAEPLLFKELPEGEFFVPTFTLDPLAAQEFMDNLWRCGYRPSEGEGSAGQLASVKYHLEDMRKLVFKESQ